MIPTRVFCLDQFQSRDRIFCIDQFLVSVISCENFPLVNKKKYFLYLKFKKKDYCKIFKAVFLVPCFVFLSKAPPRTHKIKFRFRKQRKLTTRRPCRKIITFIVLKTDTTYYPRFMSAFEFCQRNSVPTFIWKNVQLYRSCSFEQTV